MNETPQENQCPRCKHAVHRLLTGTDPYQLDVHNRVVRITACAECFRNLREDI